MNAAPLREEDAFVELCGVSKHYGTVAAVDAVDLVLHRGEFFSLLGPSGCGKTTTLRLIGGFERPTSGQILIEGRDVARIPPHKRPVNTVFQSYALFQHLNVFNNVAFGLKEQHLPREEISRRVTENLELVSLSGSERRSPRQLSGGQQQRVALARAVVNEPKVLLLDEPLGALDLKLRKEMQSELKHLQVRLGITFLYVTHDQEEAFSMSDRVGVMSGGRLVQVGAPEELYDRPLTRYVADFVGEANILPGSVVSRSGGTAVVDLGFGSKVPTALDGAPAVSAGKKVFLVVRPERIRLLSLEESKAFDGDHWCVLVGQLTEIVFSGARRALLVRVNGSDLTVSIPNIGELLKDTKIGDEVRIGWRSDDSWVITDPE